MFSKSNLSCLSNNTAIGVDLLYKASIKIVDFLAIQILFEMESEKSSI